MAASVCFKPETMGRLIADVLFEAVSDEGAYQGEFVAYEAPLVTVDTLDGCQAEW
jgi:ribose transport system substrate-binding protein